MSEEDRIFIKNLRYLKGCGAKRLISEFPTKGWKKTIVNIFLNVWKILVQQRESRVAEGREQLEQWEISAQSMTLFSVKKTHLRQILQHDRLREKRASIVHLLYE